MGNVITQPSVNALQPGRGLREFSNPTDPAVYTGTAGLQFNVVLGGIELLAGVPLAAAAPGTGASYLSNIHGGLGSDARSPAAAPAAGFNSNAPAFAGPEAQGLFLPPAPQFADPKLNSLSNTEKILRSPSDNPNNNGTIWTGTEGRRHLNFSLWISRAINPLPNLLYTLELYRDLNSADKIAGLFGGGGGPNDLENAQLVAAWTAPQARREQNKPNFATIEPFPIPAGCNLYLLFKANDLAGNNLAVGSVWLS